jgi:hypothetical protein
MELFKNYHDKSYRIVVAILAVMAAISAVSIFIDNHTFTSRIFTGFGGVILMLILIFTWIGTCIFALLYPFHLLNIDYKNKVMSLIFASGVSRTHYYVVKVGATILSTLIALAIIAFIPFLLLVVANPEIIVKAVREIFEDFELSHIFAASLWAVLHVIGVLVMLTTAVIITKGKTSGLFLFFGFLFVAVNLQRLFIPSYFVINTNLEPTQLFYFSSIGALVEIAVFVLIGLRVLRKQDL